MITEDYVSFEIAKLLKEKGFDEGCRARYGTAGSFSYEKYEIESGGCEMHNAILAPTIQMAMKWLREKHNIHVYVENYGSLGWIFVLHKLNEGNKIWSNEFNSTYEQACESAIKYCLENLV